MSLQYMNITKDEYFTSNSLKKSKVILVFIVMVTTN